MANGVSRPEIIVHQALHGYADGHRLITSSIGLKSRDAKVVLTLSDASGSTSAVSEDGYLTGYPLRDAGLYAFAKTWPALEMPRPGCVWTHTLFLDFADLAALGDLSPVATAFSRPALDVAHSSVYRNDLSLSLGGEVRRARSVDPNTLRRLLWALYGHPDERVFSNAGDAAERESMVIGLWNQQWPSLRRSFRFCTLVFSDRSTEAAPFDLQFGPPTERGHRSRFGKLLEADRERPESAAWLEEALLDVLGVSGEPRAFRSFLREFGAQFGGGRNLFVPLCELAQLQNVDSPSVETISHVMALLDGPLGALPTRETIATLIVQRMIAFADVLDAEQLAFVMRHLGVIPRDDLDRAAGQLGRNLWSRDPAEVLRMLVCGNPLEELVARTTLRNVPTTMLLDGLQERSEALRAVLELRPELFSEPELWRIDSSFGHTARGMAMREQKVSAAALDAMIESGNESLPIFVRDALGEDTVLAALVTRLESRGADQPMAVEAPWLRAAATPNAIARALSHGITQERTTLVALAHQLTPDAISNHYGQDPWFSALEKARGETSQESNLFLRTWSLARGLGDHSRSRAELITFGYEVVYQNALDARLPDVAWSLLDDRLPNSRFWSDWERPRRLRAGVLNAFIDRDLDPGKFGVLVASDTWFNELASEALGILGGRGYLRRVKRALRELNANRFSTRIENLSRLL